MARSAKPLLGGRYKLSGEQGGVASAHRAWDRWLNRPVFVKILPASKIGSLAAKRQFIDSAQALVRIAHPNVESLLDYGATDDGAPYHVMHDAEVELVPLGDGQPLGWAQVRGILLDVTAGVDALHGQRIVHGDISLHSVALVGDSARIVDFTDAGLNQHDLAPEEFCDDVRAIAALGYRLLTGHGSTGRAPLAIEAALARTDAPPRAQATLLRVLTSQFVELEQLRGGLTDESRASLRPWSGVVNAGAAVAAAAMLSIGLWSSISVSAQAVVDTSMLALVCEPQLGATESLLSMSLGRAASPDTSAEPDAHSESTSGASAATQSSFEAARARVEVGAEGRRKRTVVHSKRFDLHQELSAEHMVERGIDLTHGRPNPEDDPRVPIVDGPKRARALFEAACARDYGKGCHMLGVQIAEGMVPDDGAGPAEHYRRGCALDYHRSCAALADLARAGEIVADVSLLDAKACLLAGPDSSYCLPD